MNDRSETLVNGSDAPPQPRPPGRLRSAAEILGVLLGFVLASMVLAPLLGVPLVALSLYGGVAAAALFLRLSRENWQGIGLAKPQDWRRVLIVAGATTVVGLGVLYAVVVPALEAAGLPPLDLSALREAIHGDALTYALTMGLVVWGSAAFAEELLFRGFILNRLERIYRGSSWAVGLAVMTQAIVFGLLHAYQGPIGILLTSAVAVVMAVAYLWTGRNLWAPILAHGLIDSIAVTGLYLGWI